MENASEKMIRARTRDEFLEVAEMFRAEGGPEAEKQAERCEKLAGFTKGSAVTMGSYNGQAMTWHVAEENGKQRLLICDDLIGEHCYMDTMTNASWAKSSLRRWLNNDFLKNAFTNAERMSIMFSKVENPPSAKYCTDGCPNTTDRIFILGIDELERYLPEQSERSAGKWWWTRTPGMNLQSVAAVYADGSIYDYGIRVNYTDGGVRPALWILIRI